jgi:hypothetical protein
LTMLRIERTGSTIMTPAVQDPLQTNRNYLAQTGHGMQETRNIQNPLVNTLRHAAKSLDLLVGPILYRHGSETIEVKGLLVLCRYNIGPTSPANRGYCERTVYVTCRFGNGSRFPWSRDGLFLRIPWPVWQPRGADETRNDSPSERMGVTG